MSLPKTRTLLAAIAIAVVAFAVGRALGPDRVESSGDGGEEPVETPQPSDWTCSMHPQVRLPEPGQCPICFMDLVPANGGADEDELGSRVLRMTEAAVALAEIETAPVERRSVAHEVQMVGKVAFDETRLAYLTAWVRGRLDRLFVDSTGVNVRAGDHLAEIYSPKLYTAQQELLQAIETASKLGEDSLLRETSERTIQSAREKLRLLGISAEQIEAVIARGAPDEHVTLNAPIGGVVVEKNALAGMYADEGTQLFTIADLSKVWVVLEAYESDIAWLRYGQDVEFRVQAYPGEAFHGRVAFIDPVLDDRTRTVKVRLNVENTDRRLKPDMFVSATAHAVLTSGGQVVDAALADKWMCPMHPEVLADGAVACPECGMDIVPASELGFVSAGRGELSLVIPDTAPLITGKRAVVYVRLPGREKPTFEGRDVALGPRAGAWYVVHGGLAEGEEVVVHGNFKIDSELQIRARPSMMNPESPRRIAGTGDGAPGARSFDAPAPFRQALGRVADAYVALQEKLAADGAGADEARAVAAAFGAVDPTVLAGEARAAWEEIARDLRAAVDAAARAAGQGERRAELPSLTRHLVRALRVFGYAGDELAVFHCPMALDGEGADWIQRGGEIANPYFGSRMHRCGSRVLVLERER